MKFPLLNCLHLDQGTKWPIHCPILWWLCTKFRCNQCCPSTLDNKYRKYSSTICDVKCVSWKCFPLFQYFGEWLNKYNTCLPCRPSFTCHCSSIMQRHPAWYHWSNWQTVVPWRPHRPCQIENDPILMCPCHHQWPHSYTRPRHSP